MLRSHKDCHDTKFEVVQLWVNEVLRTFRDRMMDIEAEDEVVDIVRKQTKKVFNLSFDDICEYEEISEPPRFGNILDTYGFYTDLDDDELLEYLNKKVEEYNEEEENPKLSLIFNDFIILVGAHSLVSNLSCKTTYIPINNLSHCLDLF